MLQDQNIKGISLLEILVVVVIIGLISAVGYPNFSKWLVSPDENKLVFSPSDVKYLYWTAASIGGYIKSSRGSSESLVLLPQVGLLLNTALSLDHTWEEGSIYTALISYTMSEFQISEEKIKKVKFYFEESVKLSGGTASSPYVVYAESVLIKEQNKSEFIKLLNKAIAVFPAASLSAMIPEPTTVASKKAVPMNSANSFLELE